MTWEKRNNKKYYYRKVRDGARVSSFYIGNGRLARLLYLHDEKEKRRKRQYRTFVLFESDLEKRINEIHDITIKLANSFLMINGYHTRKGQWRKAHEKR